MAQKCRQRFIALQAWDVEQYSASAVVNFDVSKDRWSKPAHRCAANANTALKIRQSARQEPVAQWGTSDKDGSEDEQRQKYNECCLHAPLPFASILKGSHGMHPADGPAGRAAPQGAMIVPVPWDTTLVHPFTPFRQKRRRGKARKDGRQGRDGEASRAIAVAYPGYPHGEGFPALGQFQAQAARSRRSVLSAALGP